MHELSLASAILNTVLKHAAGRQVTSVELRVGGLRQVVPASLELSFELVGRGTLCQGARLEQALVAPRMRCAPCAHEWEVEFPDFRCPVCGGADAVVVGGEELDIVSIEVEEEACTEPG